MRQGGGANRRFESADIDPAAAVALRADHPALSEGRSIFPSTVVGSSASPRFLVSGHNNPKIGRAILKGPRIGWPIFHVTLEERATCPRTCEQWATCYGNAMPQARRHRVDADFESLLQSEVATVARQYPGGFLVRLHILGDFYSASYVMLWARLLAFFPQLHVFGYTARRIDDPDPESAKTARAIQVLTDAMWDRFAIRTSGSRSSHLIPARSRSIVVDEDPGLADVIVCPAQVKATESCASCGLCWADAARDKTIAFLRHGMTRRAKADRPAAVEPKPDAAKAPANGANRSQDRVLEALRQLAAGASSVTAPTHKIGSLIRMDHATVHKAAKDLEERGVLRIERPGKPRPNVYHFLTPGQSAALPTPAPVVEMRSPPQREPVVTVEHALEPPEPPQSTGSCTLLNLRTDRCHFPVGAGEPQLYCNKPAERGQYCAKHHNTMRVGSKK